MSAKRMGRPLKEHAAGTLVTITMQVPAELKTLLQDKAIAAGRSLSAECQRRLERSFDADALQKDAAELILEPARAEIARRTQKAVGEIVENLKRARTK
jgi:hypothetical protein